MDEALLNFRLWGTPFYKPHRLDISRPAARENYWATSVVESLGHIGIPCRINVFRGIAAVKLQHIHTPLRKGVCIILNVPQGARVTTASGCANV